VKKFAGGDTQPLARTPSRIPIGRTRRCIATAPHLHLAHHSEIQPILAFLVACGFRNWQPLEQTTPPACETQSQFLKCAQMLHPGSRARAAAQYLDGPHPEPNGGCLVWFSRGIHCLSSLLRLFCSVLQPSGSSRGYTEVPRCIKINILPDNKPVLGAMFVYFAGVQTLCLSRRQTNRAGLRASHV
jgi:hypothetical protein